MKMLDLTHCITPEMPVYPGTEPPRLTAACTMERDGFRETLLEMYSHTGTHGRFPAHMLPNGRTLDDFPAETFAGRGFVLDCRGSGGDHAPMLRRQGRPLRETEFLLFCTGWDRYWGQPRYYEASVSDGGGGGICGVAGPEGCGGRTASRWTPATRRTIPIT